MKVKNEKTAVIHIKQFLKREKNMIKSLGNIQNNIEIKIYNYENILYNLQKVLKK
jgi:hypothetical protein